MVKLDILVSYWDDIKGLDRLLSSKYLVDFANKIFIRDGRYKDRYSDLINIHEAEYSSSETMKIINKFDKDKIVYSHNFDAETQVEKRNKLWDMAEEDNPDFVMVLDADEYVEMDPVIFRMSLYELLDPYYPYRCIPIKNQFMKTNYRIPRLFKPPFNYRHVQTDKPNTVSHAGLYDRTNPDKSHKNSIIMDMHKYNEIYPPRRGTIEHTNAPEGFLVYHDKSLYTNKRILNNEEYYRISPNR